ncbi:MAG: hypothetical protein HFG01_11760 [Oscillibacter sp.]|nr:hypothetical protein [Oscillibacter sp.]
MARVFPLGLAQGLTAGQLLEQWLGEGGGPREEQAEILLSWQKKGRAGNGRLWPADAASFSGGRSVRGLFKEFLDYVLAQPGSGQMIFFCSEGLELLTQDAGCSGILLEKLRAIFKRGKRLQVVLRTNYQASDVALVCGPWLREHFTGCVQSFYYDDFRVLERGSILFGLRGSLMMQICIENSILKAMIHQKPEAVAKAEKFFDRHLEHAGQRVCYSFFLRPANFLHGGPSGRESAVYLLEKFPDLGIDFDRLSQHLCLRPEEKTLLQEQFWMLTRTLREQSPETRTFHIFCEDMIDEAIDGAWHLCRPFSEICGRRLYLSTRGLAEQLDEMRRTLERRPSYQVCFMPHEWFDRLGMELVVWGSDAAVGWAAGRQSAACRDYPNVAALHGFCATVWDKIPPAQRSRKAALKRLERWLVRAKRLGIPLE